MLTVYVSASFIGATILVHIMEPFKIVVNVNLNFNVNNTVYSNDSDRVNINFNVNNNVNDNVNVNINDNVNLNINDNFKDDINVNEAHQYSLDIPSKLNLAYMRPHNHS